MSRHYSNDSGLAVSSLLQAQKKKPTNTLRAKALSSALSSLRKGFAASRTRKSKLIPCSSAQRGVAHHWIMLGKRLENKKDARALH